MPAADTPLTTATPRTTSPRAVLAAMYTARLADEAHGLHLEGLLVLAEAFHLAAHPDGARAPLTPPMLIHALAHALEEHHAVSLPADPAAALDYLTKLEVTRGLMRDAMEPGFQQMREQIAATSTPQLPPGPHPSTPLAMLRALAQCVAGWLQRPGRC